jgi:hypothetical protein
VRACWPATSKEDERADEEVNARQAGVDSRGAKGISVNSTASRVAWTSR